MSNDQIRPSGRRSPFSAGTSAQISGVESSKHMRMADSRDVRAKGTESLAGGGEMGSRMRAFDWSKTPLGPVASWPQSLKTAVRIMLTSRQPIWIGWGAELTYLYNDAYKSIVGGKHPQALGQPTSVVWREIWEDIGPLLSTALGGIEGTYVEAQRLIMERHGYPEETYYTFSYSPVPDDAGGVGGIICANTDDTRRVIGERRLSTLRDLGAQATQAKSPDEACRIAVEVLAENTKDIPFGLLYMKSEDGTLARLRESSQIAAGGPASPSTIDLLHEGTETWPIEEAIRTGFTTHLADVRARFGDLPGGAWAFPPEEAIVVPIRESESLVSGALVLGISPVRKFDEDYRTFFELAARQIATTIGNARAYEEEKRRAEALAELDRAKTAFFSNVSHEFRTPLTLLLGPVEEMLAEPESAILPETRKLLGVVHRNALRLQKLVNTLLDFSRIEAGRVQASFEPTDLAGFTAELVSVFRSAVEKAGMRLIVDCQPLSEPAYIDRDMWEKIVLNLVSNAFKFTLEGEIEVSLRQEDHAATLRVRDTGTGIAEEQLPHIFERFHRVEGARARTDEGTGIGLALVQELVGLHGGTVRVESVDGHGTTFTVQIPLGTSHLPAERIGSTRSFSSTALRADHFVNEALKWVGVDDDLETAHDLDESSAKPLVAGRGERPRILVADDNADMRNYLARLLSSRFVVTTVSDGEAALGVARESPPDLVLSDAMMPKLDGFGLLKALRSYPATQTIPIIMLSARAGEEARVEGLEAGVDDYLIKPFNARELLARVSAAIKLARVRREAAAAVRESDYRFRMLFESMAEGYCVIEVLFGEKGQPVDFRFLEVNPAFEKQTGLKNAKGRRMREIVPGHEQRWYDTYGRIALTGETMRIEDQAAALGRWYEMSAFRIGPAEHRHVGVVFNDITERKRNAARLEQQKEVLELIAGGAALSEVLEALCRMVEQHSVATLYASVLTLDRDGIHLRHGAAPSLPEAYNLAIDGMAIGPSVGSCGTAAYRREPVLVTDIATDPLWRDHAELALSHGLRACWSQPILSGDGKVLGTFAMYHPTPRKPAPVDLHLVGIVTRTAAIAIERQRAEAERERLLKQAQDARAEAEAANHLKDEFLATLSHELRTPLNAIVGWTKILRTGKVDREDVQEGLEVIDRNAKAQTQLIEDLLDLSRIMSGKLVLDLQRLHLQDVIEAAIDAVTPTAQAKGVRIGKVLDSLAPPVSGDSTRLQQVVWNLLTNAVKFTPKGGKVQVLLERVNSHVEISVMDTGIGIRPDFLPHVFDRFRQADGSTTRRHGGLGLGLAIVKHLVEMHGGAVRVKSPGEGQGSTFVVVLPVAAVHLGLPERTRPMESVGDRADDLCGGTFLNGIRVLVVDDESDARGLMKRVLSDCGATVEMAGSAPEALQLIETFIPDVLVSDIGMPEYDGYDLIRGVRKRRSGKVLPAAALTAFARSDDRMRAMRAGFQVHVAKPVNPDELIAVVAALAGRSVPISGDLENANNAQILPGP
jgi:PAS domain S-box-containing protein